MNSNPLDVPVGRRSHALYVYKAKQERLLTLCSFLLRQQQPAVAVVAADRESLAIIDSVVRYSDQRSPGEFFHPVLIEELATPGTILGAATVLEAMTGELAAIAGRYGAPVGQVVVDMQFIATHVSSAQALSEVTQGLRGLAESYAAELLALFFVESLPKYGLQPFLDQFDQVAICDSLKRFLHAAEERVPSPLDAALLGMALKHEAVLRHVLTMDAAEPRGSRQIERSAVQAIPEITDLIDAAWILLDLGLRTAYCSRTAAELFGSSRRQMLGASIADHVHPASFQSLRRRSTELNGHRGERFHLLTTSGTHLGLRMRRVGVDGLSVGYLLEFTMSAPCLESTLTTRESQILRYVVSGVPNREIATQLSIAEVTVKKHLTSVYRKHGVRNKLELISALHADASS